MAKAIKKAAPKKSAPKPKVKKVVKVYEQPEEVEEELSQTVDLIQGEEAIAPETNITIEPEEKVLSIAEILKRNKKK